MDNKKYYWIKLKDNFFDRPEIKAIEAQPNGYEYICIMLKMTLRSLQRGGKLTLTDYIPYDLTTLSKVLDHNRDIIKAAIDLFAAYKLVEIMDDRTIYMMDIELFIGESTTEADRIRKLRHKVDNHGKVYICTPELEKELEIDIEKDINIEREDKEAHKAQRSLFQIPEISEVKQFITDNNYQVDADRWYNFYSAKNWMIGKNKMKDWKAAIRTWLPDKGYKPKSSLDILKEKIARGESYADN